MGMKKLISLICVGCIVFTLTACRKNTAVKLGSESEFDESYISDILDDESETESTANTEGSSNTSGTTASTKNKTTNSSTKRTTGGNTVNDIVGGDVTIKDDVKTPVEAGLNLGGKTINIAISSDKSPTQAEKSMIENFGKTYNCKVKYDVIDFATYMSTIAAKNGSGVVYDVVYLHGSQFPSSAINRIIQPLESAISKVDLYKGELSDTSGIDMTKSQCFEYNGHLYGLSTYNDAPIYLMFYNKVKFEDSGLEDPMDLYNKGQWTWKKLTELGSQVTNIASSTYFSDGSFCNKSFVLANSGHYIVAADGTVKENFMDTKIFNGLKFVQSMCQGSSKILNYSKGTTSDPEQLLKGKTYMYMSEDIALTRDFKNISSNEYFNKSISNLGIVPVPLGPDNQGGEYPSGWICGYAACRGAKDLRVVGAYAKFCAQYAKQNALANGYTEEQWTLMTKLRSKINYVNYSYGDSTETVGDLIQQIENEIVSGKDVTSSLKTYRNRAQNCIDVILNS